MITHILVAPASIEAKHPGAGIAVVTGDGMRWC